jgi:hypothetical protein
VPTKQFNEGVIQNECRHAKHHERRAALIICHGWIRVLRRLCSDFFIKKRGKMKKAPHATPFPIHI